jgi:putative membrane protein
MTDKGVLRLIYVISALVFITVVVLFNLPKADNIPEFAKSLPLLNAFINGTCSVLLVISLYQIRRRNIKAHKKLNITCFLLSAVFLLSYVTFHAFGVETKFPLDNPWRPLYLVILLTHILLAAVVLPLVLLSFYWGIKNEVAKHRRLTRWSFPIWLYVTVTGVVVYLMISPYYSF